jgi:hypothetical protein
MQLSPWVIIFSPVLGFIVISLYRAGRKELMDEKPTLFSFIYGTIFSLLFCFFIAGILFLNEFKSFPLTTLIVVIFLTAALIFAREIPITNNKLIDSMFLSIVLVVLFSLIILGFLYVTKNEFPWELVFICTSTVIFFMRIVLWISGK